MNLTLRALWTAVERFAAARGAVPGTFLWNFGQGAVLPGPSELVMLPLAIADPTRTTVLAVAAWGGSVLGAAMAYGIGALAFEPVAKPLLALLSVGDARFAEVVALLARYGWLMIMVSTLTPISTKAIMITAGATGLPFAGFMAANAFGRLIRYVIIVVLLRATAGPLLQLRERVLKD
jgi:membrane protein YqaA with SNARE-associated domain